MRSCVRGATTEVVDLAGATLLPGFVEAHGHPIMTGAAWGDPVVDIRAIHTPTYEAAIAKIKRRVAKAKPGEFLWFLGLDPALHQGMREPTMAELMPSHRTIRSVCNPRIFMSSTPVQKRCASSPMPMTLRRRRGGQIYKDKGTGLPWKFQEAATVALRSAFVASQGSSPRRARGEELDVALRPFRLHDDQRDRPDARLATRSEPMIRRAKYPARLIGYERATPAATMTRRQRTAMTCSVSSAPSSGPTARRSPATSGRRSPISISDIVLNKMGLPRDSTGT